jgi:hypothetical protein
MVGTWEKCRQKQVKAAPQYLPIYNFRYQYYGLFCVKFNTKKKFYGDITVFIVFIP